MLGFGQSGWAIGNKRDLKRKMYSPQKSLYVVLYSVVVFNQSGLAIGNTSAETDISKISKLLLVYKS